MAKELNPITATEAFLLLLKKSAGINPVQEYDSAAKKPNAARISAIEEVHRIDEDLNWSEQARDLRTIAAKHNFDLELNVIYSKLKQLRLVDKKISILDQRMKEFNELEELSLTGNFLNTIDPNFLPGKLQVLMLCANELADISGLASGHPCVVHLGLGFNKIERIVGCLPPTTWPRLVSLDLTNNELEDLGATVEALAPLATLRSLAMAGNPCSLLSYYRPIVVERLQQLAAFDGAYVTEDERRRAALEMAKGGQSGHVFVQVTVVRLTEMADGKPKEPTSEYDQIDDTSSLEPIEDKQYHIEIPFVGEPLPDLEQGSQEQVGEGEPCPAPDLSPVVRTRPQRWDVDMFYGKSRTFKTKQLRALRDILAGGVQVSLVATQPSSGEGQ
eukprot:Colp12_sorted_trinity150504_noHs@36102